LASLLDFQPDNAGGDPIGHMNALQRGVYRVLEQLRPGDSEIDIDETVFERIALEEGIDKETLKDEYKRWVLMSRQNVGQPGTYDELTLVGGGRGDLPQAWKSDERLTDFNSLYGLLGGAGPQ
jgi:hypothetical protein